MLEFRIVDLSIERKNIDWDLKLPLKSRWNLWGRGVWSSSKCLIFLMVYSPFFILRVNLLQPVLILGVIVMFDWVFSLINFLIQTFIILCWRPMAVVFVLRDMKIWNGFRNFLVKLGSIVSFDVVEIEIFQVFFLLDNLECPVILKLST